MGEPKPMRFTVDADRILTMARDHIGHPGAAIGIDMVRAGLVRIAERARQLNDAELAENRAETIVPMVPPEALDAAGTGRSRRFYTLFEVEEWKPVPPADPALLEHIGGDLYAVRAVWDLTELERAVIAGTR